MALQTVALAAAPSATLTGAISAAILAAAALAVHLALLCTAPAIAVLADGAASLAAGRPPGWQRLASLRALLRTGTVVDEGSPDIAGTATASAFALTLAAGLAVPSFATGLLLAPLDDLVLVAFLLVAARAAAIVALAAAGGARTILPLARLLGTSALILPAFLLATLASSLLGGTRLDAVVDALGSAPRIPAVLAGIAFALIAVADLDADRGVWSGGGGGAALDAGLSGPLLALARLTASLRLLVWLDLVGAYAVPVGLAASGAGPVAWAGSLLLWALRTALLAMLLGVVRAALGPEPGGTGRAHGLLASAALLGLLATVFVLVGQSVE